MEETTTIGHDTRLYGPRDELPEFDIAWVGVGKDGSYVKINGQELPGVRGISVERRVGEALAVIVEFVAIRVNAPSPEPEEPMISGGKLRRKREGSTDKS